jgi:hypothetical protein
MTISDDEREGTLNIGEDLVPLRQVKPIAIMQLDFDGLLHSQPLKLEEDVRQGCGGMLWPAGMVMAKYLMRQSRDFFVDKSMFVIITLFFLYYSPLMPRRS